MKQKGVAIIVGAFLLTVLALSAVSFARGAFSYYGGQSGVSTAQATGTGPAWRGATTGPSGEACGNCGAGSGRGFGGGASVWAQALKMTEDEFRAARSSGATIEQLAEKQGLTIDEVTTRYLAAQKARLDSLVEQGKLTRAQADTMLNTMKERMTDRLDDPVGPPAWAGRGNGQNGANGAPGACSGNCPNCTTTEQ